MPFGAGSGVCAGILPDARTVVLDLKRQLILQGVPGTGKTHVACCLARLLTRGLPDHCLPCLLSSPSGQARR